MRHHLATTLAVLSLPFAASLAEAKGPVPEGTKATIHITMSVKEKTKSEWSSTAIDRVLKAQCLMVAGPAMNVGMAGPTAQQQAAIAQSQVNAQAFQQNYADETMMQNAQAIFDKCGEDEACVTAEVMKMSQTPEAQAMAGKQAQAKKDMAGLTPDLGPLRYQSWSAQSCSGEMRVNDTYVTSDPGGEGGDGAYTDTTTVKGTSPIDPQALTLIAETDTVGNTTTYQLGTAVQGTFQGQSSMKGAVPAKVSLLASTALPPQIGPLKGVLGKQSTTVSGDSGSIKLSFQGK
ncbi:hypothetical protein [Dongia rigui]|uniref:Uncharacterized protein n=1 Tax=Dongia rigui TaxID=940149 RepID=A0ABU5DWQ7_9PROT|nr:hypothetical protein [Dongia rigui]MDY0871143.1 hypothetical protein [Dongia rigui]